MTPQQHDVTLLLAAVRNGDPEAMEQLMPAVYGQLRRLAARYMRNERTGHTLQPTALVNEAYLKMVAQPGVDWKDRAHFFGIAARMMRQILIDHARTYSADKRGGGQAKIPLDEALAYAPEGSDDLIALDEALIRLQQVDARQSRIVELRFFGGLSVEETAEVMGISERTVKREWSVARLWLHREIAKRT